MKLKSLVIGSLFALAAVPAGAAEAPLSTEQVYKLYCGDCHGAERLGGMGPALVPENLVRVRKPEATEVIRSGRPATQMPGFGKELSEDQIKALVDYVYAPLLQEPRWGIKEMEATRVVTHPEGSLPNKPIFAADPLNLFLVVEAGDHHVSVLDGDKMERIFRFPSRYALHGGPKYSPDGRYVYFCSRDGWVTKFDMYNFKVMAEIRAGINARNAAVSGDGKWVVVANYLPHTLVFLDARDLKPVKIIDVKDKKGQTSRVSAVYDATPRKSFIAALKDVQEIWEIPYTDDHPPIYNGLVHDHALGEGIPEKGPFPVRRIPVTDYFDDFFFDQSYKLLIGAGRNSKQGQVIHMDPGSKIAELDLPAMPHLASGITWEYQGGTILATPSLEEGKVSFIDMKTWKTIKRIDTLGPGFFMRSHKNSKYAWVDVFTGPNKDAVHVIDKKTLEIVKTLRPVPGKTSGHIEYTRDGRYALLSIWEIDGALIVYDADTLEEVKRIPASKPVGKYNVYNKITREEGTSH